LPVFHLWGGTKEVFMKSSLLLSLGFLAVVSQANADAINNPPLASGKPAGLHNAQLENGTGMLVVAGAALIGITVGLATAGSGATNNTGATSPPTSTSTSTTGTSP
jgi:hypothetical protein